MNANTKKSLAVLALIVIVAIMGVGVLLISQRLATQQPVAPTAPESRPSAAEWVGGETCNLSFTIDVAPTATPTATATSTPTATPTPTTTPTATPTVALTACNGVCDTNSDCQTGFCSGGVCRNSACSSEVDCTCATATATPTVAPVACNGTCTTNANCATGLNCVGGVCRNSACSNEADCICATAIATPTTTPPTELPEAGISLPTLAALAGGVLMVLLGILFAL